MSATPAGPHASEGEPRPARTFSADSSSRSAKDRAGRAADDAVASAYDARAAEYVAVAGTLEQMDPRDLDLIAAWREATGGLLLDAGCGPGHWTEFLSRGGRAVRGIDLSEGLVAAAREAFPEVGFEVANLRTLPFETARVGGVLAWYSLIHTPPAELPEVLAEFARVLAPGGTVLIGFFDGTPRERFDHAIAPAYYWSAEALGVLLAEAGFTVVSSERRGRAQGEISARPHASVVAVRTA